MTDGGYRIGVDLGGTKISGVLMNPHGEIKDYKRVASPQNNYEKTVQAIKSLVHDLSHGSHACIPESHDNIPVGVGIPGSLSPATGIIQNANSTWLNGKHFDKDLSAALNRPVRLANDANCFALSEAIDGAGKNSHSVFGVILGTGCGGAIVIDKKLVDGPRGISGEWGHNPLPWPDVSELNVTTCWCGHSGCIETWISGPGFSNDHYRVTGVKLTAKEIVAEAMNGSPDAEQSLDRLISRIARGLASIVNIVDPDTIILGGGLSQIEVLYQQLPDKMAPYIFCDHRDVSVLAPIHGDDSGVRGAAWL